MVLFLHITARIEGRKDDGLLATIGGSYFPYLVAMDDAGKVVALMDGDRTADGFRAMMKSGKEYVDWRTKAEKGDSAAKIEVFIRDMILGEIKDLEAATKQLAAMKNVSKDQKTRIDEQLVLLEVQDVLKPWRENRETSKIQELHAAAGKTFLEMHKKGRVPKAERPFGDFYSAILTHAEVEKDIPVFEEALKLLEERFPKAQKFFDAKRKVLENLKEEKKDK